MIQSKREKERERMKLPFSDLVPQNACDRQNRTILKPRDRGSICVSCVSGRDSSAWTIVDCLLRYICRKVRSANKLGFKLALQYLTWMSRVVS